MNKRLEKDRGYVTQNIQDATGRHFNRPGNTLRNMSITFLKRVKSNDPVYRKERERYYKKKIQLILPGKELEPRTGLCIVL